MLDDLEALMELATREAQARKATSPSQTKRRPEAKRPRDVDFYRDPNAWQLTALVDLIHRSRGDDGNHDAPVGRFLEYIHKKESGARRLVRTDHEHPDLPLKQEIIYGFFPGARCGTPLRPSEQLQFSFSAVIHAELAERQYESPQAFVEVVAVQGLGILQVLTSEATRFVTPDGKCVLWLPKGFDLLPDLARATKLELKPLFDAESALREMEMGGEGL